MIAFLPQHINKGHIRQTYIILSGIPEASWHGRCWNPASALWDGRHWGCVALVCTCVCLTVPSMQVGMFKIHPEIPETLSAEARACLLSCFEPDPHKRVTAAGLLQEGFFRQVHKGKKNRIAFKPAGEVSLDRVVGAQ